MNQEPLIHVFENEIPFNTRINLYDFCSKSQFELGGKDGNNEGEIKYASNIHSSWSKENILLIDQSCNFIFYQ